MQNCFYKIHNSGYLSRTQENKLKLSVFQQKIMSSELHMMNEASIFLAGKHVNSIYLCNNQKTKNQNQSPPLQLTKTK